MLRRSACLQVPIFIWKSDDRVGVSYVHPLRVVSRGIEGDAVRLIESSGEGFILFGLTLARDSAEHLDLPAAAFCQEKVAIGGSPQLDQSLRSSSDRFQVPCAGRKKRGLHCYSAWHDARVSALALGFGCEAFRVCRNEDYVSKHFERWKELAALTSEEQDPAKLTELANVPMRNNQTSIERSF